MTINLPFLAIWRDSMLSGRKIMTARTKQYGQPGDTFEIFGCTFELVSVNPLSLQEIALSYWYEEGCSSPANFVEAWIKIHPRAGYQPEQVVWLHEFKQVTRRF